MIVDPSAAVLVNSPSVRNVVLAVSLLYAGELDEAFARRDDAYRLGLSRDGFLPLLFAIEDPSADAPIGALLGDAADANSPRPVAEALAMSVRDAKRGSGRRALQASLGPLGAARTIPVHQRFALALLARHDDAAMALGATLARQASWFMSAFWIEAARPLRQSPAFAALTREVGLDEYWSRHGAPDEGGRAVTGDGVTATPTPLLWSVFAIRRGRKRSDMAARPTCARLTNSSPVPVPRPLPPPYIRRSTGYRANAHTPYTSVTAALTPIACGVPMRFASPPTMYGPSTGPTPTNTHA